MPPPFETQTSVSPGAPTWLAPFSAFLKEHGIATLFACVLLWLLVMKLPEIFSSQLAAQATATATVGEKLDAHAQRMDARDVEAKEYEKESLTLLRAICVGVNERSATARAMCGAGR